MQEAQALGRQPILAALALLVVLLVVSVLRGPDVGTPAAARPEGTAAGGGTAPAVRAAVAGPAPAPEQADHPERQQVYAAGLRAGLSPAVAEAIWTAATAHKVAPEVVLRVIEVESNWNPGLEHVNTDGSVDRGLMQLNDSTWPWLARRTGITDADPLNPLHNVQMGIWLLGYLQRKYGDLHHVLTAYNQGEGGLERHVLANRSGESTYSRRVLQHLHN